MIAAATHMKRERPGVVKAAYATSASRGAIWKATAYRSGFCLLIGCYPQSAARTGYITVIY
jgi:hypothetical protein